MILRKMSPSLRVEIIYQLTALVASVDAEPIELAHVVGDLMVEWVPESGGNAGSGYKVIVTREVPPCAYAIPNDSIVHIHELPLDTPPPDESPRASMVANEEIILCRYCSKKIDRPTFHSLVVEEEDEAKEGGGIGKSPVV